MANHDAVFWDVGGVILDIDSIADAQRAFVAAMVAEHDPGPDEADAYDRWVSTLREHFTGREGTEYVTAREGRRKAMDALFDGNPPADWRSRHEAITAEHTQPNPGALATIRRLAAAGVYQAIISDADEGDIPAMLERFDIADCVAHVTTSEAVGHVKPDRRIFAAAFEKARSVGVDPGCGVMIGDKYYNDMLGGTAVGLTTVAYGAEEGPAVDHRIETLPDLLDVVGVEG